MWKLLRVTHKPPPSPAQMHDKTKIRDYLFFIVSKISTLKISVFDKWDRLKDWRLIPIQTINKSKVWSETLNWKKKCRWFSVNYHDYAPWLCNSTRPQHTLQMFADHYGPRQTIPWETINQGLYTVTTRGAISYTARFSLHQVHGTQCTKEYYTKYSWRTLADVCMVSEVLRVVPRCWVLL